MNAAGEFRPGSGFEVGAASHPGKVRSVNEDRFFVAADRGVFAVADGMGGHEGGALASAAVVDHLSSIASPASASDLLAQLEDRIIRANAQLHAIVQERGAVLGSTVAALLTHGDHFACLWSGDSRVYLVRARCIRQVSRDHTEVRDLVDKGILTAAEAKTWPRRNVITRAVGVRAQAELELEHGTLEGGDVFVLCSDGLTGHVEDDEILDAVQRASPQSVCDALVDLTLQRGATDNVTVVVVRVDASRTTSSGPAIDTGETLVIPAETMRGLSRGALP